MAPRLNDATASKASLLKQWLRMANLNCPKSQRKTKYYLGVFKTEPTATIKTVGRSEMDA